jgi:DNA-binding NarL/FixJ family response regulator
MPCALAPEVFFFSIELRFLCSANASSALLAARFGSTASRWNCFVDALSEVPTLRVVNSNGRFLLTPGEEQVVALVADGLTNRGVATEIGLSEHTIKI